MAHGYGRPYIVDLRITQRCNLRCRFCPGTVSAYDYGAELDLTRMLQAVDDAAELGVSWWVIVGDGEPFCRADDCLAVMRAVKEHGMRGSILTNGTLLAPEAIREIVGMGWDRLTVSLDGADAGIHDYLRGIPGAFARVTDAIDRFNDVKAESGVSLPLLDFQTVMNSRNYAALADIIRLAAAKRINTVNFQPLVYHEGTDCALALSASQAKEMKASIPEIVLEAKQLGVGTNLGSFLESPMIENANSMHHVLAADGEGEEHPLLDYPCYEPWYLMAIKADGHVAPCRHVRGDSRTTLRTASLKDIWDGDYFTSFRRRIARGKMFKECEKCCAMGVIDTIGIKDRLRGDLYAIRSQGYENTIRPLDCSRRVKR